MKVEYVDMRHEQTGDPDRAEEYDLEVRLRVSGVGREDAATLTDAVHHTVAGFVDQAHVRRGSS